MKKLLLTLLIPVLSFALTLKAAQDTTNINVNVTILDYVNFIGSANGATASFSVDDIQPIGNASSGAILSLGTLGLESSSPGDCDIEFSAKNDFRLEHLDSNIRLTAFRLRWKGEVMSGNPIRTNKFSTACNSPATIISFQAVARFNSNPQAGIYQDIVTVTVTTQ